MTSITTTTASTNLLSDPGMPVWVDDNHLDGAWLLDKIQQSTTSAARTTTATAILPPVPVEDVSNKGRLGSVPRQGGTLILKIPPDFSFPAKELVMKQTTKETNATLSQQLGLAREALFYRDLAPQLGVANDKSTAVQDSLVPRIYYTYGNWETGEKCIIMESSSQWIDSGILFGPTETFRSNPNNWTRDIPALLARYYPNDKTTKIPPTPVEVAHQTFCAMARIHAKFWCDPTLLDNSKAWLRGHAWLQGQGHDSWQASRSLIQSIWKDYTAKDGAKTHAAFEWDPLVRSVVQASIDGISWQDQQDRLHVNGRWTLVHGDFWPGNVMWNTAVESSGAKKMDDHYDGTSSCLRLLDWEMVGLGSGPQDLGQYMLSGFCFYIFPVICLIFPFSILYLSPPLLHLYFSYYIYNMKKYYKKTPNI